MGKKPPEERRRVSGDDGLVIAIEMVVTPLLFAAAGFGIDTWLGTRPWFTAILGIVAFAGKLVGEWYRYVSRMNAHEAELKVERTSQRRGLGETSSDSDLPADEGLPTGVTLEKDSQQ